MGGSSRSTLILTTLLSIIGWLAVTMYHSAEDQKTAMQLLALKVNTLETVVSQQKPDVPFETILQVNSRVAKVADEFHVLASDRGGRLLTLERDVEELREEVVDLHKEIKELVDTESVK